MNGSEDADPKHDNGKIPVGWRVTTIGSCVAALIGGASPSEKDYTEAGVLVLNKGDIKTYGKIKLKESVRRTSSAFASKHASKIVSTRSLLVTLRDLSSKADFLGLIGLYEGTEEALITQGMYSILLSDGLLGRYLMYYSNAPAYRTIVKREKHGATQVHLRNGEFLSIPIAVAPISEQRRIVQKLDDVVVQVDACRKRLHKVQQILKKFREAVLEAAVSGRLTEDWRLNAKLPKPHITTLGEYCDVLGGRRLPEGFALQEEATPFPYIRVVNFHGFSIDPSGLQFVPAGAADSIRRYIIDKGDVFISIAGTIGLVGQVPGELSGANLTENAARIVVRPGLSARYLMYQLASPELQSAITSSAIATTQSKLGLFRIKALNIRVPPIQEQQEIVRRIELLFEYANALQRRFEGAMVGMAKITPAVLSKAFRGELVPQDPNDEPVGEMLERIQGFGHPSPTRKRAKLAAKDLNI